MPEENGPLEQLKNERTWPKMGTGREERRAGYGCDIGRDRDTGRTAWTDDVRRWTVGGLPAALDRL